jgi:hypothetical protein
LIAHAAEPYGRRTKPTRAIAGADERRRYALLFAYDIGTFSEYERAVRDLELRPDAFGMGRPALKPAG